MSVAEAELSTVADDSPRSQDLRGVRIRGALLLGPLPLVVMFFIQLWQQKPHYQFIVIYVAGCRWPVSIGNSGRRHYWMEEARFVSASDAF